MADQELETRTRYDPAEVESRVLERWLESGRFHPEPAGTAAGPERLVEGPDGALIPPTRPLTALRQDLRSACQPTTASETASVEAK